MLSAVLPSFRDIMDVLQTPSKPCYGTARLAGRLLDGTRPIDADMAVANVRNVPESRDASN